MTINNYNSKFGDRKMIIDDKSRTIKTNLVKDWIQSTN